MQGIALKLKTIQVFLLVSNMILDLMNDCRNSLSALLKTKAGKSKLQNILCLFSYEKLPYF